MNKSYLTNLLETMVCVIDHLDEGVQIDIFYFDFKKAFLFDRVSHIRPMFWFKATGGSEVKNYFLIFSRAPPEFSHTFFRFQKGGITISIFRFTCNCIAIYNFKFIFEISATKKILELTSILRTLKFGTHVLQGILFEYNAAIFISSFWIEIWGLQ